MTDALFARGLLTDRDVACLIASEAGVDPSLLERATPISDLPLSLLDYEAVLATIEDHFDVQIDDLVGAECATLGELMDRLKACVACSLGRRAAE